MQPKTIVPIGIILVIVLCSGCGPQLALPGDVVAPTAKALPTKPVETNTPASNEPGNGLVVDTPRVTQEAVQHTTMPEVATPAPSSDTVTPQMLAKTYWTVSKLTDPISRKVIPFDSFVFVVQGPGAQYAAGFPSENRKFVSETGPFEIQGNHIILHPFHSTETRDYEIQVTESGGTAQMSLSTMGVTVVYEEQFKSK